MELPFPGAGGKFHCSLSRLSPNSPEFWPRVWHLTPSQCVTVSGTPHPPSLRPRLLPTCPLSVCEAPSVWGSPSLCLCHTVGTAMFRCSLLLDQRSQTGNPQATSPANMFLFVLGWFFFLAPTNLYLLPIYKHWEISYINPDFSLLWKNQKPGYIKSHVWGQRSVRAEQHCIRNALNC